jgi:methionyl-tRNA formyltransferase
VRAVFCGTPGAAVPSLHALSRIAEVDLVVTRPDAPRGRHRRLQPPPVKEAALELGLPVAQPSTKSELAQLLVGRTFDVGVVVAFGMILPPEVLAAPGSGFVNVHFSLLPRWRGAAPVERALMAGDNQTGVTIMLMDEGLDTGPVLAQRRTRIEDTDTGGTLRERLAEMGAALLEETLPAWVAGEIQPVPQPDEGVTYAARLEADDRLLSTDMGVVEAWNRIRALAPDIGARLDVDGVTHKVLGASPTDADLEPGEWADVDGVPVVGFADGALAITIIQPPGKRAMGGAEWLRGRSLPG